MMKKSSIFVLLILLTLTGELVFGFFYSEGLAQTSDITATVRSLPGAVAQVKINSITDNTVPSITANVVISNESAIDYEYTYEWCVVSNGDNECGGGDDVFDASATKWINAGEDWNTNLNAAIPNAGSYWFKLIVYWDSESSGSYITFTTEEEEAPPTPPPSGGGGGGGGAVYIPPAAETKVIIQGKAYPSSKITVLQDGKVTATVEADSRANFKVTIAGITAGTYSFGVWAEDTDGRRSITFTFTSSISSKTITTIGDIFIPPTIELSEVGVERGETLNILGQTAPKSEVSIFISSPGEEIVKKTEAGDDGTWFYPFDTTPLEEGSHTSRAKATSPEGLLSTFSNTLAFSVGKEIVGVIKKSDINNDKKVNLVDFSILLYNWGPPKNPAADLNSDGKVNLIDFSIMLYWWTG